MSFQPHCHQAFAVVALFHLLAFVSLYILLVLSTLGRFLEFPVWNGAAIPARRLALTLLVPLPSMGVAVAHRIFTKPDFLGPFISLNVKRL